VNGLTSSGFWTTIVNANLWQATLAASVLLTFPAIGGVISERSGVVNIAMEGMMLTGAFFAVFIDIHTRNAAIGLLAGILVGGLMSLLHAVSAIRFKADQIVSGMAINLGALGLTSFLLFSVYGTNGTPPACVPPTPCLGDQVRTIPNWSIPLLNKIPGLGQILFQQNPMFYLMLLFVVAAHIFLFHTTLGLRIRAVGEHPRAADTAGINVQRLRYLCVLISGLLSGLAGGYLGLTLGSFSDNMTSGRGFIALAAMIFGKWTPFGAFGACILFGFGEALFDILQSTSGPLQDYSLLLGALPYLITIAALAGFIGRAIPPAADGIPYDPAGGG
jgi:general nucleoside transport system permease protein